MKYKNTLLNIIIILIAFLIISDNTYSQKFSLIGKLVDENNSAILFTPVSYEFIGLRGQTKSNCDGFFNIQNLTKGKLIKLQIYPLEFSKIDTTITISMDTVIIIFKIPCLINGELVNQELAKNDIHNNNIRIITPGGFAPPSFIGDADFELKYNITFWTIGDNSSYISNKCILEYNNLVFKFIDTKYGESWRTEIRPDVLKQN